MLNHIGLLKDNVLNEISDNCKIIEKVESTEEEMIVNIKNKGTNKVFVAFNEMNREQSRIRFLKSDRFPDSIIISIGSDGKICCHICELKRTPANGLKRLGEQLFSGYMHCKLLLAALHVDFSKVIYKYHVFKIHERNKLLEYNTLSNRPKKIIPGTKARTEEPDRYAMWLENQLKFTDESFSHNMSINKHKYNCQKDSKYYFDFAP